MIEWIRGRDRFNVIESFLNKCPQIKMSSVNLELSNGKTIEILDSGVVYSKSMVDELVPENVISKGHHHKYEFVVNSLSIPSSRYYYKLTNGYNAPYLSLSGYSTFRHDLAPIRDHDLISVYRLEPFSSNPQSSSQSQLSSQSRSLSGSFSQSLSQSLPMASLGSSEQVNTLDKEKKTYEDEAKAYENVIGETPFLINGEFMRLLDNFPYNKGADIRRAITLSEDGDPDEIQEYLNSLGVITFTGLQIYALPPKDIFFYLTRFYGPPVYSDLETNAHKRVLTSMLINDKLEDLVNQFDLEEYRKNSNDFNIWFTFLNHDFPQLTQESKDDAASLIGAGSSHRLLNAFWDYFSLLTRKVKVPLDMIRVKSTMVDYLGPLLSNYTDQEIHEFIYPLSTVIPGLEERYVLARRRRDVIDLARSVLLEKRVEITNNPGLCVNPTNLAGDRFDQMPKELLFLSIGSTKFGFYCYGIEELLNILNDSYDGTLYTFNNPYDLGDKFQISDLIKIYRILRSHYNKMLDIEQGMLPQSTIDILMKRPTEILDRYSYFITIMKNQQDIDKLGKIQDFMDSSSTNIEIIKDIFKHLNELAIQLNNMTPRLKLDPQGSTAVNASLDVLLDFIESISSSVVKSYLLNLPVYYKNEHKLIKRGSYTIQDIINLVKNHKYHGDNLAQYAINTSIHYYTVLFGENLTTTI